MPTGTTDTTVLELNDLRVSFRTRGGSVTPVDGVSLTLRRGEVLGLVGESGSGKSVTSLAVMGLLPRETGTISGGEIRYGGRNLAALGDRELRAIRGNEIAMVFQEPMTSLNPAFTVGDQLREPLRRHLKLSRRAAAARAVELLAEVGIPQPQKIVEVYPHQLSGGMRQRVMIAMAMSCEPSVLIADEPTTALDVTIQAQILELLADLCQRRGTAVLLITHDLGVVAQTCQRVAVMYCGQIVEQSDVATLFAAPRHPYTQGLLAALPGRNADADRLTLIPGTVPPPNRLPPGCRFAPRCPHRHPACDAGPVPLYTVGGSGAGGSAPDDHLSRCLLTMGESR